MSVAWLDLLDDVLPGDLLEEARENASRGRNPVDILLESNLVPAEVLLDALGRYYNMPVMSLPGYEPQPEALQLLPQDVARALGVFPLFLLDDRIYVAFSDPMALDAQDRIRQVTGRVTEVVLAPRAEIEEALNRHYLGKEQSAHAIKSLAVPRQQKELAEASTAPTAGRAATQMEDSDAPAIKLVNYILQQAVLLGASDIHLEPFAESATLRYRVDSILHEFPPPPHPLLRAIVSRVKIIANMDTSERRLPQDGRASVNIQGRPYDLRVSTIATMHGEGFVIRVLDPNTRTRDLVDLGLEPEVLAGYEAIIKKPYGLVLVAGPTGSGKSTTLYASIQKLLTSRRKFITLEDPIEYQLPGVNQIHVNPDIGMTFATGLRAILRQDPDVVMVGEIRDRETAEIALRASMTGHLIFSTLHANTAPLAVTRLIDLGVAPFYVMSSLLGVVGQRLLRQLCPDCKMETRLTPIEAQQLGSIDLLEHPIQRPRGCVTCNDLGYKGRTGLYELLPITSEMRRLPPDALTPERLASLGAEHGYVTMRAIALRKLLAGITSLEEVVAVTADE